MSWRSMMKISGSGSESGSGSVSQMHGSADPDPDLTPKCHGSATTQAQHTIFAWWYKDPDPDPDPDLDPYLWLNGSGSGRPKKNMDPGIRNNTDLRSLFQAWGGKAATAAKASPRRGRQPADIQEQAEAAGPQSPQGFLQGAPALQALCRLSHAGWSHLRSGHVQAMLQGEFRAQGGIVFWPCWVLRARRAVQSTRGSSG